MSNSKLEDKLIVTDPKFDIVYPDDCADFLYDLDPDLPPPARQIGVKVSPEVKHEMQRILERYAGLLYQRRGGLRDLLNLFEGPLAGISLLEMKRLTAQILSRAREFNWSYMKTAGVILRFVQREIRYVHDEESTGYSEYGRFPLQTLMDREGDCECVAILCCALLAYCGYPCALILIKPDPAGIGHAVPGLLQRGARFGLRERFSVRHRARLYLYGEATGGENGWQHPTEAFIDSIRTIIRIPAINLGGNEESWSR